MISEQNRTLIIRKYRLKIILIGIAVLIAGAGISFVQTQHIAAVITNIIFSICSMCLLGKMYLNSFSQSFLNVHYIIENNSFIIRQNGYERLKASKDAIRCITHYQDNRIVMVLQTGKKIDINPYVENYNELVSKLKRLYVFNEIYKKRNTLLEYTYW